MMFGAWVSRRLFTTSVLQGKVAVVTGGTSGIGATTARRLAERHCKVVIAGRSVDKGNAVVDAIRQQGGEAIFVSTDVSNEQSVKSLMDATVSQYGTIDLLLNNAGVEASGFPSKDFGKFVREDTVTIQTNLLGSLWAFSYALPSLVKNGGVVVNMSSNASANGRIASNVSAYAASKAALDALTRHWSVLYRKQNVLVYALNPFFVATPMLQGKEKELAKFLNPSRIATPPDDIAKVALAMFDGSTSYKTGDCVLVDTGPLTANIQVMYNLTTELEMKNIQQYLETVIKPALTSRL